MPRSAQGRAFTSDRHIGSRANTTPPYPPHTHHRMRVFVRQGRGPSCFHCSTYCTDASAQVSTCVVICDRLEEGAARSSGWGSSSPIAKHGPSSRYKGRYSREGAGIFMPFRLEDTYVDDIGKLDGHKPTMNPLFSTTWRTSISTTRQHC